MTVDCFRSFARSGASVRLAAAALAGALLLQGCGGGGDATANATGGGGLSPPAAPAPANHAPTITGSPSTSVQAGRAYSFTPTAADADGDTLAFSITNKPSWATFNATTGQLSGTPATGNVGTFAGVTITVSDGKDTASLSAYTLTVAAVTAPTTGSATLSWTPPTQRSDGSALTDLAGYRIRYGTSAGNYTQTITVQNPGIATYVVDSLVAGTYFFVVTAFDSNGGESQLSNSVSKTIS